jgi:acyl-coenzyme A synthetase/AMP-(fatty) acid ligase
MIIRSGFNVYPAEVELALNQLPGVQRSAVVGRPENDGNEEVIAFVELQPGATLDERCRACPAARTAGALQAAQPASCPGRAAHQPQRQGAQAPAAGAGAARLSQHAR